MNSPALCIHCGKEDWECGRGPWFFAMSSYSHTDRRLLVKVLSRRFANRQDADLFLDCEKEVQLKKWKPGQKVPTFFVAQVDHDKWQL